MKASHSQFVLDCSVTMAWCFEDEVCNYSEKVLDRISKTFAITPALWSIEVVNVLLMAERRKRIPNSKSIAFIEFLNRLMIQVDDDLPHKPIFPLHDARETALTTYDVIYLELAVRKNLPLATLDRALIKAAKKIDIEIFEP